MEYTMQELLDGRRIGLLQDRRCGCAGASAV